MLASGNITDWMQKESWRQIKISAGPSNISQEPETEPTQDMQNVMLSCRWTFLTTETELTLWHKDWGKKKKKKEINCFILHCIGLDFKYGSSVGLETTENTSQRWQTEDLGEPCVPSQLLHGFCISCGVQDKHPRISFTATPVKKTAILLCSTRKRYRLRIPLTLLSVDIYGDKRPFILVGLVHSYL